MLNNVLSQIGEYNPQLMREIKSRVSWRNVIIMTLVSFVSQIMVLIGQSSKLPLMETKQKYYNDQYCFYLPNAGSYGSNCKLDAAGLPIVDWLKWWSDTALGLSAVMAVGLFAGGVYLLASNFSQEERRGTLNFIRLTPQQASSVIGGKLAGVPLLVYMGTALALPLQFHAIQQAHLSQSSILGWDILIGSLAILLNMGAILATMWFKAQSILLAGIAMFLSYPLVYTSSMWYDQSNRRYGDSTTIDRFINWYGLHIGNNFFSYLLLTGLTSAGIYWLYQAIQRRYLKPTATVLSKKQSYLWSAMYHVGMAGFAVFGLSSVKLPLGLNSDSMVAPITSLFSFSWFMLLIPLLLPSQQSLVEWSRQRPVGNKKRNLWADLIGHEKSPAMLAVAINIAIAAAVWLPLILMGGDMKGTSFGYMMPKILLGIGLTTVLAIIYSTITHWVLFWKVNQRYAWMVGIVSVLVFLPPIFGMVLSAGGGDRYNVPLLFSPFLWTSIERTSGFTSMIVFAFLVCVAAGLNLRLWRGLNKVGRSESFKNFKAKSA
jgi:ABC-type transport system involved in cytochrome c biogenesis permease component